MSEKQEINGTEFTPLSIVGPVPAARPLSEFSWEQIDDDLVLFDVETLQYHTLNTLARQIWFACDGSATAQSIASELDLPLEIVESTVATIGEAGLLCSAETEWDGTLSRRRAAKLIAAGLAGAVGIPVVKSITAPDAASAETPGQCQAAGAIGVCGSGFGGAVACFNSCRGLGFDFGICQDVVATVTGLCCFCGNLGDGDDGLVAPAVSSDYYEVPADTSENVEPPVEIEQPVEAPVEAEQPVEAPVEAEVAPEAPVESSDGEVIEEEEPQG